MDPSEPLANNNHGGFLLAVIVAEAELQIPMMTDVKKGLIGACWRERATSEATYPAGKNCYPRQWRIVKVIAE